MNPWRIPLVRPTVNEYELEAIARVFESGMLTQGEETARFEREFADYVGSTHAVATTSGTTALHLALVCLGIKHGDEVVVPDFTFPATGNVVYHCGASPVLCDIWLDTFQMNPHELANPLLTDHTQAVMPVSEFGLTADMKPIMDIAHDKGLYVVEDACPALGSTRNGTHAGTFGDCGCFSFHPRKLLGIGEGGMLVTDDDELAEHARCLQDHGRPDFAHAGYNYRLSDVQSAIGRVQLKKLNKTIEAHRLVAKMYDAQLAALETYLSTPMTPSGCSHTYQSYVILLKKPADNVRDRLREQGIEVQFGTYCLHTLPAYHVARRGVCQNAFEAWTHSLALPIYEGMTDADVTTVVDALNEALTN